MPDWLYILARDDGDDWMKLIPFGIMVVLWLIGAIAKGLSGKKAEQQPPPPPAPRPTPPPVMRAIGPMPSRPQRAKPPPRVPTQRPQRTAPPKRRKPAAAPPPVPVEQPPMPSLPAMPPPAAAPTAVRPASSALTAASIRRWLTPRVLRQQYIVTEVFDPPKALREE